MTTENQAPEGERVADQKAFLQECSGFAYEFAHDCCVVPLVYALNALDAQPAQSPAEGDERAAFKAWEAAFINETGYPGTDFESFQAGAAWARSHVQPKGTKAKPYEYQPEHTAEDNKTFELLHYFEEYCRGRGHANAKDMLVSHLWARFGAATQAPAPAPSIADIVRVLRLKSNNLSRYSFFLADPPGVKRVLDSCGNWVSVHELSELLDDSSTDWLAQELGVDPDAAKWAADDLESLREGDAMLREIGEMLRDTPLTGSYAEMVRQLIEAFQAPAVAHADTARLDWLSEHALSMDAVADPDNMTVVFYGTDPCSRAYGRTLRAAVDVAMHKTNVPVHSTGGAA